MLTFWTKCHFWKCKGPLLGTKSFQVFPLKKQGKVAKEDARVKGALEVEVITYCPYPTPPFLSTELLV